MESISDTSDVSTDSDENSEDELAPNGTGVSEEHSNRYSRTKRSSCFTQAKSRGRAVVGASAMPSVSISNKLRGIENRSQILEDEIFVFKFSEKHVPKDNNVDACTKDKCACDPVASCEILQGFSAALKTILEYRSRMCPYVVHACLVDASFGVKWTWVELGEGEDFLKKKQVEESEASGSDSDSSGEGVDHVDSNSSSFVDNAEEEVTVREPVQESSPGGGTAHSAPHKSTLRLGPAIQAYLAGASMASNNSPVSDISDSPFPEENATENVRSKPIDLSSTVDSSETTRSTSNQSSDNVSENPTGKQRTTYSALWVYDETFDLIRNQNSDLLSSSAPSKSVQITEEAKDTSPASPQRDEENCADKANDPKTTLPKNLSASSPKADRVDEANKDPKDSTDEMETEMVPEDLSLPNQRASEATVGLIPELSLSETCAKTSTGSGKAPESVDPVSCPVVDSNATTTKLATELSNPGPATTNLSAELETSAETEVNISLTLSSPGQISNASSCPLVIDTSATSTPEKQQAVRQSDETPKVVTVSLNPCTSEKLGSLKLSEGMCARTLPYVRRNSNPTKHPRPESPTNLNSRKRASTEEREKGLPKTPTKEPGPSLPLPESTPSQVNKIPEATAVASIQTYVSLMRNEEKEKAESEASPGGRKSLDVSKETPQTKLQGGKLTIRKSLRQRGRGMRETDAVCLDLENGSDTIANTNDSQPVVTSSNPEKHDSSKADDKAASSESNTKPDETPKTDLKKQGKRSLPKASRPAPARVKKARMAQSTSSRESGEIRTDSEDDPVNTRKDQQDHSSAANNDGSDFGKRILRPRTGTPTELDSAKQSRTIASRGKPVSNDGQNETTEKSKTESKTRASKSSQSPKKNQSKKRESHPSNPSSTDGANHGTPCTRQPPASDVQVISEAESDSGESHNSEERLEKKRKRTSDRKLVAEREKNSVALQSKASVSNVKKGTVSESESDSGESQNSEMPLMERLEKRKKKRASFNKSLAEYVKKLDPISFRKPASLSKDARSDAAETQNSEMPVADGLETKNTTSLFWNWPSGGQRKSVSDTTVPLDPKDTDKPLKDKDKESDQQKPAEGNAGEDDNDIEILDEYIVKTVDSAHRAKRSSTRNERRNSLDNPTQSNRTRSSSTNSNKSNEGQEKSKKVDASKVGSIHISFDKSNLKPLPSIPASSVASTPSGSSGGVSDKPPLTKSVSLPAPTESASDPENNWGFKGMPSPRKAQQIARGLLDTSTKPPQTTSSSSSNEEASNDKSQAHSSKSTSSATGRSSPITRSSSNPSPSSDSRNLRRRKQVFDPRNEAVKIIPKIVPKITKSVAESIIGKHLPTAGSSTKNGAGTSKDNFVKSGTSSPPTSKPKPTTPIPTSKPKPARPMASFVGGEIRMSSTNNPSNSTTSSEKNQSAKAGTQPEKKSTNNEPTTSKQPGHQSGPPKKSTNESGNNSASAGILGTNPNETSTSRASPIATVVTSRANPPTGQHTSSGSGERNARGRAQHEKQDGPAPLIRPPSGSPPATPLMSVAVTVDFDTPPDAPSSHGSNQNVNTNSGAHSSGSSQDHNHNGRRSGSADRGRNSRRRNYGGGSNSHHRGGQQHNRPPGLMQVPFGPRSPPSFYEYGPRFPPQPPQFRFDNQMRGGPRPPFHGHHNNRNFGGGQRSTSGDRSNRGPNNYR